MKKTLIVFGVFLVSICAMSFVPGPPCGSDAFLEACAPNLGDYTFINTFPVSLSVEDGSSEFSYIMSKGAKYRIVICDQDIEGNKMKVELYDRNRKLIASNYLRESRKYYPTLNYTCAATGVYYIESSFKSGKEGCGVVILGFTK